jgi:hypothetical protein
MANAKFAWRYALAFTLALDIEAATLVSPGLPGKMSKHRFTRSNLTAGRAHRRLSPSMPSNAFVATPANAACADVSGCDQTGNAGIELLLILPH